jgi:flagellar motor switch protein FliM
MAPSKQTKGQVGSVLQAPQLSIEKLPVLQSVFERVAPACAEMLRDLAAAPASFFLNQIDTGNSWDALEAYEDSIAVIFNVPQWDTQVLIGIDRRFIFSLLEVMYGGDMSEPSFESNRPFTSFESRVGRHVCELAASAFQTAFAQVASVELLPERTETALDFTTLGQANFAVITAQLLFQILDSGGRMFFLLPQAPLYPLRQRLERDRPTNQGIADPIWVRQMQSSVAKTEVHVEASLRAKDMRFVEILTMKLGQVLAMKNDGPSPVVLECDGERLFRCRLGQTRGMFTIEVDQPVDHDQEFAADLLASLEQGG